MARTGPAALTERLAGLAPRLIVREATGGWAAPLAMLMASAVLLMGAGVMLGGGRTVDQDLAESSS